MNTVTQALVLKVTPNPFLKNIRVSMDATHFEMGSLNLFNIYGQAILRKNINLQPGINQVDLEPEDLPAGLYYLHYKTQITGIFIIMKLLKN